MHHDEGVLLGVSPPSQSVEEPIPLKRARSTFLEACSAVVGLLDLASNPAPEAAALAGVEPNARSLTYRKNTAFIMMWISRDHPKLDDVRDTVKDVFKSHGIDAIRGDEIEHEEGITDRILHEIDPHIF